MMREENIKEQQPKIKKKKNAEWIGYSKLMIVRAHRFQVV